MYAEDVIADPYPYYGRIREEDPVHWNAVYECWLVTRYEDIVWLLRHPELFSSRVYTGDSNPPLPPIDDRDLPELRFVSDFRSHEFEQKDPPEHRPMRRVVNSFFSPSHIEQWREMVRSVVDALLDDASGRDVVDVRASLASPLPLLAGR